MTEIGYAKKGHLYAIIALLVPAFILLAGNSFLDSLHIKESIYIWTIYRFFNIFWNAYLFYFLIYIKKQKNLEFIAFGMIGICIFNFLALLCIIYFMLQNEKDLIDLHGLDFILLRLPLYVGRIWVIAFSIILFYNTLEGNMKRITKSIGFTSILAVLTTSISSYFDLSTYFFLNDQYDWIQHLINVISALPLLLTIILYIDELKVVSHKSQYHLE